MSRGGSRRGAGRSGLNAKAESVLKLDVRRCVREGWLVEGRSATLNWSRGDERIGSIGYTVEADRIQLDYCVNGKPVWQPIPRRWTACHFGGRRQWFGCPTCERSVAVLYLRRGWFACRTCKGIAYQSQSEDFLTRVHRRRERFEARLGDHWSRPEGMHQTTYERLMAQIWDCETVLDGLMVMFMERRGWLG